jgi:hypothetical protein
VHPAYLIGGAVLVGLQLMRLPLAQSSIWMAFANSMAGFVA